MGDVLKGRDDPSQTMLLGAKPFAVVYNIEKKSAVVGQVERNTGEFLRTQWYTFPTPLESRGRNAPIRGTVWPKHVPQSLAADS
jgi:hypothetical protein